MHRSALLLSLLMAIPATPRSALAESPSFEVPQRTLSASLQCSGLARGRQAILLVHGTTVTAEENWGWNYVPALLSLGFGVCTVDLPNYALEDIQISAEYVVHAIRSMAAATRARVSVLGYSQGAIEVRWALRWWPDIRYLVDDYISLLGVNHGTVFSDGMCTQACVPALWQMRTAAQLLDALNEGDETPGPVSYTSIFSTTDEFVQPQERPWPTSALRGARNIAVQDLCPGRQVSHIGGASDAVVFALVVDALTHRGPAVPARIDPSVCEESYLPGVTAAAAADFEGRLQTDFFPRLFLAEQITAEPPLKPYAAR